MSQLSMQNVSSLQNVVNQVNDQYKVVQKTITATNMEFDVVIYTKGDFVETTGGGLVAGTYTYSEQIGNYYYIPFGTISNADVIALFPNRNISAMTVGNALTIGKTYSIAEKVVKGSDGTNTTVYVINSLAYRDIYLKKTSSTTWTYLPSVLRAQVSSGSGQTVRLDGRLYLLTSTFFMTSNSTNIVV